MEPLLAALGSSDEGVREHAMGGLTLLGPSVVSDLAKVLVGGDPAARLSAVEVLRRIGGAETVTPLEAALNDESWEVRLAAVEALGATGDQHAVSGLMDLYRRDPDAQVRYECLTSLGAIGDRRATGLLVEETRSDDRYARMWAMDALCVMGEERAARLAPVLLRDPDRYVRRKVLESCRTNLDTPEGRRALLVTALDDEDTQTALWAGLVLGEELRAGWRGGGDTAETLRAALEGPKSRAIRAALVLGELSDGRAADVLLGALGDSDIFVRQHAAHALGRLGDRRAVPPLIDVLEDEAALVRTAALGALRSFAEQGDERARDAVRRHDAGEMSAAPRP